jgi:hypothetical protein
VRFDEGKELTMLNIIIAALVLLCFGLLLRERGRHEHSD